VTTLEPFRTEHVAAAAVLLAERHRRHRRAQPLLPHLRDAEQRLHDLIRRPGASGACIRDGRVMTGYLIGTLTDEEAFGRHVVVGQAGLASRRDEQLRDLYAFAAPRWIAQGARLHVVTAPALGGVVDAWFRLGFGHMQVYGLRPTIAMPGPAGVAVRPVGAEALAHTGDLQQLVWRHQAAPPTLTGRHPPAAEALRRDWAEAVRAAGARYVVAELDGRIVGHALACPAEPDLASRDAAALVVCATLPAARGRGVASALCAELVSWSAHAGHRVMITDWRMTNLEASRFWPRRGFRPVFYRLHRVTGVG
jgi:GNAT superfamily N-acetyltransferase